MMKHLKYYLVLINLFSISFSDDTYDRPRIGLVLSGGGALGFAHIGMLQVIDSLNIPIDYIAGTSMGGIAGGLYALGYSGNDIEMLVQNINWMAMFTDMPERNLQSYFQKKDDGKYQFTFGFEKGNISIPSGLIHGQKISMLLSNLTYKFEQIENFDDLPIPYRCVAVDLITGNEVILKSGSISKALRSTMSIPSVFNPVVWGDSLLIDGGLLNNLPVDVAKQMGAELVIAVNVSQSAKSSTNLNSAFEILDRSIAIPAIKRSEENIKSADIYIEPELSDYRRTDFRNRERNSIIEQGKIAAKKAIPELLQLMTDNNILLKSVQVISDKVVRNIYVTGNHEFSSDFILNLLNISSGDKFDIYSLETQIASMKLSQYFESVEYELVQQDGEYVDIFLKIIKNISPTIFRVSVRGNETIPFSFIYRFLGINPSDTLNIDLINERIDELYGLGYFETINYEIEPVNENSIHLIFVIKEASRSLLRLGFHYDETYKFVGAVNLISTKILIPGLRFESTLRFSGLSDFSSKLYYPIRFNNMSVYPYLQSYHKNIPINIFGTTGRNIAQYSEKSTSWSAGLGFISKKTWATEIEYNSEYIKVNPDISLPDTLLFPSWNDKLNKLQISSIIDSRDNVFIPKKGFMFNATFEGGLEFLESDVHYNKFEINYDYYKTFYKRHTFRLFSQLGYSTEDLPIYKWFYYGGPNRLVGAEKNELSYYRMSLFGIDYRFMLTDKLYLKTMFNIAPNYLGDFYPIEKNVITGYGFGFKYLTYLGPIELIFSRGDKIAIDPNPERKNFIYLNFGYYLK